MAYDKVYPTQGQSILAFDTNQEDRVASGFGDIADYVVEQGVGYRKWESGVFEQWGNVDNAISTPNAAGAVFIGADKEVIFPRAFIGDSPRVKIEVMTGSTVAWTQLRSTTINRFYFLNCSTFQYTGSTASSRLLWEAKGRWK